MLQEFRISHDQWCLPTSLWPLLAEEDTLSILTLFILSLSPSGDLGIVFCPTVEILFKLN